MIDLHLHTNMSDGSDSPLELLEKVKKAGCKYFSITDHDDLKANNIIETALNLEEKNSIKFITGCEISSVFEGRNLHLLCYGFDKDSESVKQMITEGAVFRRQRIAAMLDHLKTKHGIIIPDKDKAEILSRAIPGKVHIADAAAKLGIEISRQEFFNNCLDDMESREFKIEASRVIDLVSKANGVVALAHPIEIQREYAISFSEIAVIAKKLKEKGLTAIEVYHSLHGGREVSEYLKIAKEAGLYISSGSDYHGKNKDVEIGQLNNYGYIPSDEEITLAAYLETKREIETYKKELYNACSEVTCYPRVAGGWSENNRFRGHCAVVSLVVYDKFGGLLCKGLVKEVGETHYFNEINGKIVDLTAEQYGFIPTVEKTAYVSKETILSDKDTMRRYNTLSVKSFLK